RPLPNSADEGAGGRARATARARRVADQGAGADPGGQRDRGRSPGGQARPTARFRRGAAAERAVALRVPRGPQAGKGARSVRAAGRAEVGKGGVVRDPAVHARVVGEISSEFRQLGFEVLGSMESPLQGPAGNREYLVAARRT